MSFGTSSDTGGYYNNGNASGSGGGPSSGSYKNRNNYVDGRNSYSDGRNSNPTSGRPPIYCEFFHYKGHTKDACYKLHGYPKKKGDTSHSNANTTTAATHNDSGTCDSSVSSNDRSYSSSTNTPAGTQGMSMFTHE